MATIANLVVSLGADSSKLTKALTKTRKSATKWAAGIAKSVGKIGGIFTGIAAIIGGAFIVAVNKSAASIDAMTKAAGKLNFPIEDYQRFAFIAAKSNIEMSSFGKSMQRMLKTVGDSRAGLKTASDALGQLGLKADDLAKLNPSQQFTLIAEKMKDIPTQADKVKIAMDIFGRSGADLLNVFAGDVKGIGDEFDSLGLTLTDNQVKMVAAFQDSKTTLSAVFSGFTQQVTAEIAPAFTMIVTKINDTIIKMGGMKTAAASFAKFMVNAMAVAIRSIGDFIQGIADVRLTMLGMEAGWIHLIGVLNLKPFASKSFSDQMKDIQKEIDKLDSSGAAIIKGSVDRSKIIADLNGFADKLQQSLSGAVQKSGGTGGSGSKAGPRDYAAIVAAKEKEMLASEAAARGLQAVADSSKALAATQAPANVSEQFKKYAEMAKTDIKNGSAYAGEKINVLQNLIASAKKTNVNINGGTTSNATITAMQKMVDSLRQVESATQTSAQAAVSQAQPEKLGEVKISLITNVGEVSANVLASSEFARKLKTIVAMQTNDAARAVAQ